MWQKVKNIYHLGIAILANIYFFFPGKKLIVIGITGTDGKTTTSSLVYHILKTANKHVSLISTVGAFIGDGKFDVGFHVTNPSSIPLQRFLRRIVKFGKNKKENYLVLEVTSHGIDQNRVWGIPFYIAGLTNITHEHLDYHKNYKNYVAIKTKLLQKAKIAVINKDDESFNLVNTKLKKNTNQKVITYGLGKDSNVNLSTVPFKTSLVGEYNKYNCLLAVTICHKLGISDKDIQNGITTFTPPLGRTEIVYDKNFNVMIDFAHTPNAFKQLLSALRPKVKGRLIHVFGSAGLRDKTKRPVMGKVASEYDDIIILTSEDPRSENVEEINKQIRSQVFNFKFLDLNKTLKTEKGEKYIMEIQNRQNAIDRAIALAKKGDMVLVTGKGHEKSMNFGKGEEDWDEFEAVKRALEVLKS